jgi:peptidoglycan/xylan/chitin deacetylase (PgdA/CDA1 family)
MTNLPTPWAAVPLPPEHRPLWLGDRELRLPELDGREPRFVLRDGDLSCAFDSERMIQVLREERYAEEMRSPTRALPFSYARLPAWLRLLAARSLYLPKRWRRPREDPSWPEAPALDLLMDLLGRRPTGLWGEARWSLAVTHDVDSVRGLRCCLRIAERVEAAGFRSCFYVVGEAADREPGILRELRDRGHEIGSHDWHHDNRLCFLPSGEMEDRIRRARAGLEPYDGMGFRSPSLLRSPRLLECLGRHFGYDSSVCDTDLEYRRGCTTVFPFLLRGCLEIPATLPMDSSLTYVGYSPDRMLALWKSKCAYIRELGGLAVSVTHAEPHLAGGAKLLDTLERFLDWVGEQADCSVRLPCEIAQQSGVAGAVGT